jgi:hypothetical protein
LKSIEEIIKYADEWYEKNSAFVHMPRMQVRVVWEAALNSLIKENKECEVCGSKEKKPNAKYCTPCKKAIESECLAINKEAWKRAIEIVRDRNNKSK